jgi:hypothetical protein
VLGTVGGHVQARTLDRPSTQNKTRMQQGHRANGPFDVAASRARHPRRHALRPYDG